MADAVGAEEAFFSTCGSSLSVKAAMLAVAGGGQDLLFSRDAHKSVVAGLIFSGVQPRWIRPRWDPDLHLAHPPSPEMVAEAWERHPDACGALIVSPTPYGTCADIEGIAQACHARGKPLIVDEAWGAHLPFHAEPAHLGHERRRRRLRRQRAQDGRRVRARLGVPPAGIPGRPVPPVGVRRSAHDDEPERHGLRSNGRLASADGPARHRTARARAATGRRRARPTQAPCRGLSVLEDQLLREGGIPRPRPPPSRDRRERARHQRVSGSRLVARQLAGSMSD